MPAARDAAPRRVLLAQKFSGLGGAQVSLVQHLEHLERDRFAPRVLVAQEGWLTRRLDRMRVPWALFPFGHWTRRAAPWNLLRAWRLARYLRRERIELVHANEHWVAPLCLWAARLAGVPIICHFRTGLEDLTPRRVRRYRYARYDRVVAVADVLREAIARQVPDPARVVTVRDGVEAPAQAAPPRRGRGRTLVLVVGALRRFKGQLKVIEAALPWLRADARRVIALAGGAAEADYAEAIAGLIRAHGLGRQVRLLGSREDVARLLALADALVAYSSLEGVPRVVMEAMAAGRPVIVSDTPGMREAVADGEVGRVVDFRDAQGLSRALEDLSADPVRWRAMGARARDLALGRHSTAATSRALQDLYGELL
jgi:glycosyltransferase involved in cell wall biosynthesis